MKRPLAGITVIEFAQYLAAPYAGLRLADLGARVIKVERPGTGDAGRALATKNMYVDGSHELVHTLAEHGLVDEYSLLVYPLVLGSGKRLFPDGLRVNLDLVESRPFPTGVILLRYQPNRG